MSQKKFKQTRKVRWLNTPEETIWIRTGFENYIQPENPALIETLLGVDLDLLDEESETLFEPIE